LIAKKSHFKDTIVEAQEQLAAFVKYVNVFKQYSKSRFNFPKFHLMIHYTFFIKSRGSLDNFTTEYFEHQHILDVKIPFRHSNIKYLVDQILSYISQHNIVIQKREYLQSRDHKDILIAEKENTIYHRLGSPRQPEEFCTIDDVQHRYNFHKLHLGIQSWVHNYL